MKARQAFLRACALDVAVRKPGNVSLASPGHRMQAAQFVASAEAAAGPLCAVGASVGERIEGAIAATGAAVGCNTNLGIVLLCAPLAAAAERGGALDDAASLQRTLQRVLRELDIADAEAAFRAIVQANPAGLGGSEEADVHAPARVTLLEAMRIAADRDRIARQYAEGYAELFELATATFGFAPISNANDGDIDSVVQQVYLAILARWPDSHIVRKHGEAVAHSVMTAAQGWAGLSRPGDDPAFAAWDEQLKQQGINPGTSADLTVAALMIAGLLRQPAGVWHGS